MSDLANYFGSYDYITIDKSTTSLTSVKDIYNSQIPIQDTINSLRYTIDYPTLESSVARPCRSPSESSDESSIISESRSDSSIKKPLYKLDRIQKSIVIVTNRLITTNKDIECYISLIDKLFETIDLETVSYKRIRRRVENHLDQSLSALKIRSSK